MHIIIESLFNVKNLIQVKISDQRMIEITRKEFLQKKQFRKRTKKYKKRFILMDFYAKMKGIVYITIILGNFQLSWCNVVT